MSQDITSVCTYFKKKDDVYHDWVSHGLRDFEICVKDIEGVNDKMLKISRVDCIIELYLYMRDYCVCVYVT